VAGVSAAAGVGIAAGIAAACAAPPVAIAVLAVLAVLAGIFAFGWFAYWFIDQLGRGLGAATGGWASAGPSSEHPTGAVARRSEGSSSLLAAAPPSGPVLAQPSASGVSVRQAPLTMS
jgi:peptidoglycan/LPS O-acetylase OafA/YrhL